MWIPLKTEVLDRFAAVEAFVKATRRRDLEQTAKGMAFVQVYAAYEFTVRSAVRTAIDSIAAGRPHVYELIPSLMGLFLDAELASLKDCPRSGVWPARIKIFERLFSRFRGNVNNLVFPTDGNHFRSGQLKTIFTIFGIKRTPARRTRHLLRIDEVVANRNDIAHGSITAESVGRRYTRKEVLQMIKQMKSVSLLFVAAIEKQCSDKKRHCRAP
jgi:hypothetical protein